MNLTRDEIAEYINDEFGLSKKDCNDIVNTIIEEIIQGILINKSVKNSNLFQTS